MAYVFETLGQFKFWIFLPPWFIHPTDFIKWKFPIVAEYSCYKEYMFIAWTVPISYTNLLAIVQQNTVGFFFNPKIIKLIETSL